MNILLHAFMDICDIRGKVLYWKTITVTGSTIEGGRPITFTTMTLAEQPILSVTGSNHLLKPDSKCISMLTEIRLAGYGLPFYGTYVGNTEATPVYKVNSRLACGKIT